MGEEVKQRKLFDLIYLPFFLELLVLLCHHFRSEPSSFTPHISVANNTTIHHHFCSYSLHINVSHAQAEAQPVCGVRAVQPPPLHRGGGGHLCEVDERERRKKID